MRIEGVGSPRSRTSIRPQAARSPNIFLFSMTRPFGGATPVEPKTISPTDPAARYTAAADKPAVYAYSDNYLIDLKHAVIMDVEATTAIRQAEVGAAKAMLDRTAEQFDVTPSRLVADGAMAQPRWSGGWWTSTGSSRT